MPDRNPIQNATDGERYETSQPGTLDLAERMSLAVNALTNVWFPEERWALGFIVEAHRQPPALVSSHATDAFLNIPPKFLEALALCRLASGNTDSLDVDHAVLDSQLALIGEDGLTYAPSDLTETPPFAEIWAEGRMLLAVSVIGQLDTDERWKAIGKRKVDRLLSLSREKDGFRYFWKGRFRPGDTPPPDADEPRMPRNDGSLADHEPVFSLIYSVGALGHGAALFYRVTGYEPALELARGLAKWALARMFVNDDGRYDFYHFHHGLYALMAVCEYAVADDDREALQRVDACYRWARQLGDPLIGFYPEHMPGSAPYLARRGNTTEICEVADMVYLALKLTLAGVGDYWDDVDRWVRNVYSEGQLTDPAFGDRIPEQLQNRERPGATYVSDDDIVQRSVGSFFGWMRANDGIGITDMPDGPKLYAIMHCCTANGARTLYYVWDSIVSAREGEVSVNLLLNRASPWVDVHSYLPVEGKVVLHMKEDRRADVRLPDWCDTTAVRVSVGDAPREPVVDGRRLRLGTLRTGERATIEFPVPERTEHRVIGEIPYKLRFRGANVVEIDPPGSIYPLYEHQPSGSCSTATRFVPSHRSIIW